jgi:hypothetical protein
MPVLAPDSMLVPGRLLLYASPELLGSQAALENTAAVAGFASALTSLAKRTVQRIRAAADLQSQPAILSVSENYEAAAYFPAAAPYLADDCIAKPAGILTDWFGSVETAAAGTGDAVGSSSSSSSQAAASAALLAVVFARSLVQLADAMEAAGPEVYLRSVLSRPTFVMRWLNKPDTAGETFSTQRILPAGRLDQYTAEAQWQVWQLRVLQAMQHLRAAFKSVGIAPSAAAAGEPAAAAAAAGTSAAAAAAAAAGEALAGDACADSQERSTSSSIGSTSNSSRSSGGQQVKWGYLLRLLHCSPEWAEAVAAYEANQPDWEEVQAGAFPRNAAAAEQHRQHYAAAISLCRALAAAAPLPVVCNNPSCENTEGVSEAAAASKACAGCRCRYCSVACQRGDWKRHKGACRRMAAESVACV